MEIVGWILVAVLAGAVAVLLLRRSENPYAAAVDRLAREMERGGEIPDEVSDDPPEVARLRRTIAVGWQPTAADGAEEPAERALRGLLRFLRGAALEPLQRTLRNGRWSAAAIQDVVDALEDLEFYAAEPEEEPVSRQNLTTLVQEAVREYTRETDIPVKLRFSSPKVTARVPPHRFKDALFLLLSNAGRFGRGETVLVEVETSGEGARVRVVDRGTGFSAEALERAFEPFWTTDPDAVGLGLTWARRILQPSGVGLRVSNREEGGGEAVIFTPGA